MIGTLKKLFKELHLPLSDIAMDNVKDIDEARVTASIYRLLSGYSEKRARRRNRKRARQDAFLKEEGVTYQSGIGHRQPRKCKQCRRELKGSGHKRGQPCPFV